jgi:hypothetical protein
MDNDIAKALEMIARAIDRLSDTIAAKNYVEEIPSALSNIAQGADDIAGVLDGK